MILAGDEPIFIHRRSKTGTNEHGNPVYTTSEILVRDVLVAFNSTGEPVIVDGEPVDATLTLYMPAGTDVQDGDVFEIRGKKWVKDGDSQEWVSPWPSFVPGVVVNVRRRRG